MAASRLDLTEALLRSYRQDGFVRIPSAIPEKAVQMLSSIYRYAIDLRKGSSYPGIDAQGPLLRLYGGAPSPTPADQKYLASHNKEAQITHTMSSDFSRPQEPVEQSKKVSIKCKSLKHRDRMIKRLQKRCGSRLMSKDDFVKTFGDKDLINNPHFMEYIQKKYYCREHHEYVDGMATNKFNAFQTFPEIREDVLLANPALLPFATAAELTGCVSLRLWCENLFTKRAMSNAYPLLCMMPFVGLCNNRGEVESRGCSMWIFLDDVPKPMGGLCVLKGSQSVMREKFSTMDDILQEKYPPPSYEFDLWHQHFLKETEANNGTKHDVCCPELRKGDALIINNATLYGVAANPTTASWSALQYHLVPDGSIFAGYRGSWVPRQLLKDAKPGDYLHHEGNFPIVFNAL